LPTARPPARRPRNRGPRIDARPLVSHLVRGYRAATGDWEASMANVAARYDTDRGTLYRWLRDGIPLYTADEFVTSRLGTHPIVVWADWCSLADLDPDMADDDTLIGAVA
jgi:hypothetical protein